MNVGSYVLEAELGRGAQGAVFRARHAPTGAVRAVKILDGAIDPIAIERFRREAVAAARAGLVAVTVHEVGSDGGRLWFAMDLCPGGSLAERAARGKLEWREAAALVSKLARGLQRCHDAGLVHRDLKPANVLFDDRDEPRVADWGLVRDLGRSRLTETDALVGTPAFMAPEQIEGRAADRRADVFALAGILHLLVTGERAFAGGSWTDIYEGIRRGARDRVAAVGAPARLDAIIDHALAFDVARRTARAGVLADELDALLAGAEDPAPRSILPAALGLAIMSVLALAALVARGRGAERGASPAVSPPVHSEAPPDPSRVRELLESATAPVLSTEAPWETVSPSAELLRLAARAAVVYDLPAVETAARTRPDPSLEVLRGLALLGTGDPTKRSEATRCLRGASGPAQGIGRALLSVDVLDSASSEMVDPQSLDMRREREELVRGLRPVLAEPAAVTSAVLGPLAASVRDAAVICAFLDHVDDQPLAFPLLRTRQGWAQALDSVIERSGEVRAGLDRRVPAFSGALLLTRPEAVRADPELAKRTMDLAKGAAERDPALAASLAVVSIRERMKVPGPAFSEQLEAARALATWIDGLLARAAGEPVLRETVRHCLTLRLAELERNVGLVAMGQDGALGVRHLDRAARSLRDELERMRDPLPFREFEGSVEGTRKWILERILECLVLLAPRRPVDAFAEGKLDLVPGHPLGAMLLWSQGKAQAALDFLDRGRYGSDDAWEIAYHEVRALALADLHKDAELQREVEALERKKHTQLFPTRDEFQRKLAERTGH